MKSINIKPISKCQPEQCDLTSARKMSGWSERWQSSFSSSITAPRSEWNGTELPLHSEEQKATNINEKRHTCGLWELRSSKCRRSLIPFASRLSNTGCGRRLPSFQLH
ncbi:unnamed protein product [Ixodes persulcatus]